MFNDKKLWTKIKTAGVFAFIPVFVFVTVMIIPFLLGIYMTITNSTGTDISTEFVGLKNYAVALSDSAF